MNLKTTALLLLLGIPSAFLAGQENLPVPDKPSSWVNDYAHIFSSEQAAQLDRKLNEFEYRSSTQIFVVTIDDNKGYPASMLAPMIGEKWGVGQKGKDNGLLILMDMQDKKVFISTGYGLEEYVPDAITSRIVNNEVLPRFKQGDYYGGIDAATGVLIDLLDGKFTPDEYRRQSSSGRQGGGAGIGGIIFMIILFSMIFGGRGRSSGMGRRSSLPFWLALGLMSGSRGSGSWGGFSGSGGGGGFGGFGGGGGGSFGGGGAGGSW